MGSLSSLRRILLVRHGECEMNLSVSDKVGGRSDLSPLTPKGVQEAIFLGKWLEKNGAFDGSTPKVYASTAVRASETARLLLEQLMVKDAAVVAHSESLLELSQGAWEGALRGECYSAAVLAEIESDPWNFKAPGGESQRAVEERMCDFVHTHVLPCAAPGGSPVVVVTHGLAIKCFLRNVMDSAPRMTWKIAMGNTSITEVGYMDGDGGAKGWHVVCVNKMQHLQQ
mmetsp:Transcript_29331/g.49268  ORF Transcript_29331/g.49268 Transcript_29331/m.49268 type:complete len:227 (+) Transcript_29331:141-821(+)